MSLERVALALFAVGATGTLAAWNLQASAAGHLDHAVAVQGAEVPDDGDPPPRIEDYEAILKTLDESIAIRRSIDDLLAEVETIVASLSASQQGARGITELAGREVAAIATILGGAVDAASDSVSGLRSLDGRLRTSARLARLIAEELEELDRKLGP